MRPQQKRGQSVYLLDAASNKPKAVTIHTGITDGRFTEVVDGVKPGDNVIVVLATSKVEGPPPMGGNAGPMGGGRRGGR